MEIKKYTDFINEARINKDEVIDALTKMFKDKPHVEMDTLPNEKGIYSLAGMKKYLSGKYTSLQVSNAHGDLLNDKNVDIKVIKVRVESWSENVPYWYMDLTEAQAKKIKEEYEEQEKSKNKEEIEKKEKHKKDQKAAAAGKAEMKKEETAKKAARKSAPKKTATKAATPKKAAKPSGTGAERAPRTKKPTK
jgi:DNA mismatch repair ATPase MutS